MRLEFMLVLLILVAGCVEVAEKRGGEQSEPQSSEPLVVNLSDMVFNESEAEAEEDYVVNVTVSQIARHSVRVEWVTSLPAESAVIYGMEEMNTTVSDGIKSTRHAVYLTALEPNTRYRFRILVNLTNTTWESEVYSFTTMKLEPPKVLNVSVATGHSYINLSWMLERPATAVLRLGTSKEGMRVVYENNTTSTTHSALIGGVYPGRSYYLAIGGYERYSGYFETQPMRVETKRAMLGDTLHRGNLSITPLEFRKEYRYGEGYRSYVRLRFENTGDSFLKYTIYAAIIDQWGRQFNLVKTSELGDLSGGILLPGAKREGFLLFEPVTKESVNNRLIIIYKNYTFEYYLRAK